MLLGKENERDRCGRRQQGQRLGGIWGVSGQVMFRPYGRKRGPPPLPAATQYPLPKPGHRSCRRDGWEVSQEAGKGSSSSSGFTPQPTTTTITPQTRVASCVAFQGHCQIVGNANHRPVLSHPSEGESAVRGTGFWPHPKLLHEVHQGHHASAAPTTAKVPSWPPGTSGGSQRPHLLGLGYARSLGEDAKRPGCVVRLPRAWAEWGSSSGGDRGWQAEA